MPLSSNKPDRPGHAMKSRAECAHKRVVDYELSENREKTGNLICQECGAIFLEDNERSRFGLTKPDFGWKSP